jgi:hypothetical protein
MNPAIFILTVGAQTLSALRIMAKALFIIFSEFFYWVGHLLN